jgi:hypothetical protein
LHSVQVLVEQFIIIAGFLTLLINFEILICFLITFFFIVFFYSEVTGLGVLAKIIRFFHYLIFQGVDVVE